ncbi:hypothetical protein V4D30_02550 [Thermodesulfovibrio sp. 3907-1M]|uniref:Uncharacterized protein n=1 Tax=Thermodesulfovibrio autotrophicus TaxID=3118333 RepID=A0AAU8H0K2_9BACT
MQEYEFRSIGYVRNKAESLLRHWSVSIWDGEIVIEYRPQGG